MTHQPPVPAGNQSPYPLHKAPHPQRDAALAAADHKAANRVALVAIATTVGAAAVAAIGWWALASRPKPKRGKGKRNKR